MTHRRKIRLVRWLSLALGGLALVLAGYGLVRHNNWYLASDQAAFLTMARDMRQGSVFHDTTVLEETVPSRAPWKSYDALQQTYYLQGDALFSRYPPGFPALLAAAGALAGERGEHWLNPLFYLVTLIVLARLLYVLLQGYDRSLAAAVSVLAVWLVLLLPTTIHLWGITVARDLPAHLLGLLCVVFAVRRRPIASGIAIGLSLVIRPDALLWAFPVVAVAMVSRPPARDAVFWAAALLVGASPLFAYNFVTLGNPFLFTQGGEFREILSWLPPRQAHAAVAVPSGGGFRLSNLISTLPGNLGQIVGSIGGLLVFAALGAAWAGARRPMVIAALLPYPVAAILFYSFWVHPDPRYLAGASLSLIGLVSVGVGVAVRSLADRRTSRGWRLIALVIGTTLVTWKIAGVRPGFDYLPGWPEVVLVAAVALTGSLGRRLPKAENLVVVLPVLALAVLSLVRLFGGSATWGSFREPEKLAAQQFVAQYIPPGSLVLTAPSLGRPAENLRVYSQLEAFYPAEFSLLDTTADEAIVLAALRGRRVFRLVDARQRVGPHLLEDVTLERLVYLPAARALEIYTDPRRAPAGVVLYEIVFGEQARRQLRQYLAPD